MKISNNLSIKELAQLTHDRLKVLIPPYLRDIPSLDLKTAMEYSLSNGGKLLRPQLIYATGAIFHAELENLDIPAASIELIHTYSLIHDDLPCMDDADFRRGKPSCHKTFGEALAVLAGDALHTLALHIMANHPAHLKPERRIQMISKLTSACGPYGMAAGQALDLSMLNDRHISLDMLEEIYNLKTGALFTACIELAWMASLDDDEFNHRALKEFANCVGLAFQIQDDILDVEASTEKLGKSQNTDLKNKKVTYSSVVGLEKAKLTVENLYEQALEAINYLGDRAQLLRDLISKMLNRDR